MNKKLEEIICLHRIRCNSGTTKAGVHYWCKKGQWECDDVKKMIEAFAAGENSYLPCSKAGCVKHASCCNACEKKAKQKGRQEVFDALFLYDITWKQLKEIKEKFGVK